MFQRLFNLLESQSIFLFGARGTGKSTWVAHHFNLQECFVIDLLKPEIEDLYSRQPQILEKQVLSLAPKPKWVVLDEIQRVPKLLNLVHSLIESHRFKFVLTGSSARKLKRGAANLLAGRAFVYHLFPLTAFELGESFDLRQVLSWGTLPKIYSLDSNDEKAAYLHSYALTYLKEEIQSEQIVRKLDPFRNFLEVAAVMNGSVLNYNKIARDVGCDVKTVQSYYQILEDTWLGFYLPAYHRSVRKSQRAHPKFYLFDPGVKRALERSLDAPLAPSTSAFGDAFEHWVILEAYRLNEYYRRDYRLSYYQTHQGAEIDLILSKPKEKPILIEVKSSEMVDEVEVNKLDDLGKDLQSDQMYFLSRSPQSFGHRGVKCRFWLEGLGEIFRNR